MDLGAVLCEGARMFGGSEPPPRQVRPERGERTAWAQRVLAKAQLLESVAAYAEIPLDKLEKEVLSSFAR